MIDLARVRALVAVASESTTAGLEAREALVPLAAQMADLLEAFAGTETEWATRAFDRTTERPEITPRPSEDSARRTAQRHTGVELMCREATPWRKASKGAGNA